MLETLLDDLEIDMPFVWQYLAEIVVHLCSAEVLSLQEATSMGLAKGTPGAAKFLKTFLQLLVKEKGKTWLEQKWIVSNISLEDIIDPQSVDKFVTENVS